MKEALLKAIDICGGQSALAKAVGVKPQAVQQWIGRGVVPVERVADIERATQGAVRARDLRPDIAEMFA